MPNSLLLYLSCIFWHFIEETFHFISKVIVWEKAWEYRSIFFKLRNYFEFLNSENSYFSPQNLGSYFLGSKGFLEYFCLSPVKLIGYITITSTKHSKHWRNSMCQLHSGWSCDVVQNKGMRASGRFSLLLKQKPGWITMNTFYQYSGPRRQKDLSLPGCGATFILMSKSTQYL